VDAALRDHHQIDSLDYELNAIIGRSVKAVLADALRDIDETVRVLRFAACKTASDDVFEDVAAVAERLTQAADALWVAARGEMRRLERERSDD
jgi:hypothetical protein